ncbi:MAG TPA: class F sortase [Sporichthyaceae bacterium]|jgi:hypothetical protein|nr:class F sortase [Sporichthyaceae bacterium]
MKRHARAGLIGAGVGLFTAGMVTIVEAAITPPQMHSSAPMPAAGPGGPALRTVRLGVIVHVDPTPGLLAASAPVRIDIAAIDVHAPVIPLGLADDGTLEVPAPGPGYGNVAWYDRSPSPGEVGPAILTGHLDSAHDGPSVFYRLGALRPGDRVRITRADGSQVTFRVATVTRYPQRNFPVEDVYGNLDHPGLRLITCGGDLDPHTRHYLDNVVVYADLDSVTDTSAVGA